MKPSRFHFQTLDSCLFALFRNKKKPLGRLSSKGPVAAFRSIFTYINLSSLTVTKAFRKEFTALVSVSSLSRCEWH